MAAISDPVGNTTAQRGFSADEQLLGEILREVITLAEGPEAVELLDLTVALGQRARGGDEGAADELARRVAEVDLDAAEVLVRALTRWFQLVNLAEDNERVRRLRAHDQDDAAEAAAGDGAPRSRSGSVRAAIAALAQRGAASQELQDVLDQAEAQVRARIDAAVDAARQAPPPDMGVLRSSVYAPRPVIAEPDWVPAADGEIFRTMDAVRLALEGALDANPEAFVAGVDVGKGGNVFALTRGLYARWPDRLLDTPISETAVMGLAVGGAMAGMTPLVELMYLDFLGVCFDQILNQAAKLRFMTGGKARMGLVIRTQCGGGRSSGSQHSQSLEALLAHVPGLTVVMPSTPADTYGLLRSAIRDPNPVVFIENRQQYGMKGPKPPADYLIPLGKAKVVREGTDLTIVSVSRMVHEALAAAEALAPRGISVEVIDLRTVAPLDKQTILASLAKTNRLLIAHEGVTDFGIGAEIAGDRRHHGPNASDLDQRLGRALDRAPVR